MTVSAGVVGVQGDVDQHVHALERAGRARGRAVEATAVRTPGTLADCDVIALPGGESTAISRLIHDQHLASELVDHVAAGKPVLATCAGLIVLASEPNDDRITPLGLIDVAVERNAFGRQRDSFEADIDVKGLTEPFPAVFIRAPAIADPRSTEVLATVGDHVVAVRDGPIVATAFHPELTGDYRLHAMALFE